MTLSLDTLKVIEDTRSKTKIQKFGHVLRKGEEYVGRKVMERIDGGRVEAERPDCASNLG